MNPRDFVEKYFSFSHNSKYYSYFSSLPEELIPTLPKTDRARTVFGIQTLERRDCDGKIVYSVWLQCDLKAKIPMKVAEMFLGAGVLEWTKRCNKYINDNYDRI